MSTLGFRLCHDWPALVYRVHFMCLIFYVTFGICGNGRLTEGGASVGPGHRGHDDEAKALVLATPDLHVVWLHGDGHHAAPAAATPAAADATGAATARAHSVQ